MTKIVRASLGLPTLRLGPQFQNSKPVLFIEYWNLKFVCNLVLGVWDFLDFSAPNFGRNQPQTIICLDLALSNFEAVG